MGLVSDGGYPLQADSALQQQVALGVSYGAARLQATLSLIAQAAHRVVLAGRISRERDADYNQAMMSTKIKYNLYLKKKKFKMFSKPFSGGTAALSANKKGKIKK